MSAVTTGPSAAAPSAVLELERLAGRIGAIVHGVDLADPLDDAQIDAIEDALADHHVIFFRDQRLDPASHLAFARRLGPVTTAHPTIPALPGHDHVFELDSSKGARANVWHTDVTFVSRPPRASILHGVEIPPVGGDTIWASTEAAYLDLPDDLRAIADTAWAVHANAADYGSITSAGDDYASAFQSARFEARHPVVRVHPRTGRRSLLLGGFTRSIEGRSADESAELIRRLQAHVTRPEHTVRWRWRRGDVVIWDNQATQHYAIDDYDGQPRRVQRVTLVGDTPRAIDGRTSETIAGDADAYLSLG